LNVILFERFEILYIPSLIDPIEVYLFF